MEHFWIGFEKQAGLIQRGLDKLKGLLTKKEYLYHGTASKNVPGIIEKGLIPGAGSGSARSSKAAEGLTFLTKDKDLAQNYADSAEIMSNPDTLRKAHEHAQNLVSNIGNIVHKITPKKFKPKVENIVEHAKDYVKDDEIAANIARVTASKKFPKGKVVHVEAPKGEITSKRATNPELENPFVQAIGGRWARKASEVEIPVRGGVHKKYIKGVK